MSKSGWSYFQAAQIDNWLKEDIIVVNDESLEPNQFRIETSSLRSRVDYHADACWVPSEIIYINLHVADIYKNGLIKIDSGSC